jgi:hypothetical protein
VVFSDEDDGSPDPVGVTDWLLDAKRSPDDVRLNLITGLELGCPSAAPSPQYNAANLRIGGERATICDFAYLDLLLDVVDGWHGSKPYPLAALAVDGTVSVTAIAPDGSETRLGAGDFAVRGGRAVQLTGYRAEAGTLLEVSYIPR